MRNPKEHVRNTQKNSVGAGFFYAQIRSNLIERTVMLQLGAEQQELSSRLASLELPHTGTEIAAPATGVTGLQAKFSGYTPIHLYMVYTGTEIAPGRAKFAGYTPIHGIHLYMVYTGTEGNPVNQAPSSVFHSLHLPSS